MPKEKKDSNIRVEKHLLTPESPWYAMIADFCHKAKNLYNHGNYLVRQKFVGERLWTRYQELDSILKHDIEYPDYKEMPTAQSAQQVLRMLDSNWNGFFAAINDWKEHKEKYLGRPRIPRYKKKDGLFPLVLTNQNCKLQDGKIYFPKTFSGFVIEPKFTRGDSSKEGNMLRVVESLQQVRFIPRGKSIVIEVVFKIKPAKEKNDNGRYAGIDLGVNNLITMATNTGEAPFIVNGRIPKAINQLYNKEHSYWQSETMTTQGKYSSARLTRMTDKRNRRIEDYMHKASRLVVDECVRQNISTIVIGKNKDWKQKSKLSRKTNQHFAQLPLAKLIDKITYKAKEYGIAVILHEESYTSGTSFLDNELPKKANYDKSRRVHRGLFKANDGRLINADVNGAFQIMRKVFPNVSADGIEGVVLRPVSVVAV